MLNLLCLVVVHLFVACVSISFPLHLTRIKGNKTSHAELIRHNSLTANLADDTIQNEAKIDLWMDSVMLNSILRWKKSGNESRYSIYYKSREEWIPVKTCSNITSNYCDLSDYLDVLIPYDFKVRSIHQNTSYILRNFLLEFDTKLLPPKFESSRHDNMIWIQPIVELHPDTKKPILKDLTTLKYQVKYWPSTSKDDVSQERIIKVKTFPIRNTEIVIDSLDQKKHYCLVLRYFEESYVIANYTSGSSNWTIVQCYNATVFVAPVKEHVSKIAIITLASIFGFAIFVVILWKCRSMYRLIQKDREIPDYLLETLAELDKWEMAPPWLEVSEPHEEPDPIVLIRLPASHIYQNDPMPIGGRANKEQARFTFNQEFPMNDLSPVWCDKEDEIIAAGDTKEARCPRKIKKKKKRKRDGSRGYHSASSDDATPNVSMPSDASSNYAQTTTKLLHMSPNSFTSDDKTSSCDVNVAHVTPTSSQKKRDDISQESSPGYTCMNGPEMPRNETERLSVNGKMDMELLPLNGTSPYENYTYCSNLYGNIPDAFLSRWKN